MQRSARLGLSVDVNPGLDQQPGGVGVDGGKTEERRREGIVGEEPVI